MHVDDDDDVDDDVDDGVDAMTVDELRIVSWL